MRHSYRTKRAEEWIISLLACADSLSNMEARNQCTERTPAKWWVFGVAHNTIERGCAGKLSCPPFQPSLRWGFTTDVSYFLSFLFAFGDSQSNFSGLFLFARRFCRTELAPAGSRGQATGGQSLGKCIGVGFANVPIAFAYTSLFLCILLFHSAVFRLLMPHTDGMDVPKDGGEAVVRRHQHHESSEECFGIRPQFVFIQHSQPVGRQSVERRMKVLSAVRISIRSLIARTCNKIRFIIRSTH